MPDWMDLTLANKSTIIIINNQPRLRWKKFKKKTEIKQNSSLSDWTNKLS